LDDVRLCVLVSGSGTILEAMVRDGLEVALVASDRRCRALDVAFGAGIETLLVSREQFGGFRPASIERASRRTHGGVEVARHRSRGDGGFGTIVTGLLSPRDTREGS